MAWQGILTGAGKFFGGASKVAAGATKTVAREGVRAGLVRGTRGKQRRRDRIQQGLFGKGEGEGGGMLRGGPLAIGSSSSIGSAIPTSQESIGQVPTGTGIIGILQSIRSTLVQILEVEKQERDRIQESILDFARDKEQAKRTAEQQSQETKKKSKGGIGKRIGGAVKAPAANIFGAFSELLKIGALDWLGNPENKEAIEGLIKFFKDLAEVMRWLNKHILGPIAKLGVALILTTVEGLGKVFDVLGNLFDGTIFEDPKKFFGSILEIPRWLLVDVLPRLVGALTEVLTLGIVDSGEEFVRGLIDAIISWFEGVGEVAKNIAEQPIKTDETNREALSDEKISPSTSDNTAGENEALLQGSRPKDTSLTSDYDANKIKDIHNDPLGLRQDPTGLGGMKKFNKGGIVKGYNKGGEVKRYNKGGIVKGYNKGGKVKGYKEGGQVDNVPAWLTIGEFVMTNETVDLFGAETFAWMNYLGRNFSTNATINNAVVNNNLINKLNTSSESGKALSQVQRESNMLESSSVVGNSTQTIGVGSNVVNSTSSAASTSGIGENYPSFGKTGTTYRTII